MDEPVVNCANIQCACLIKNEMKSLHLIAGSSDCAVKRKLTSVKSLQKVEHGSTFRNGFCVFGHCIEQLH